MGVCSNHQEALAVNARQKSHKEASGHKIGLQAEVARCTRRKAIRTTFRAIRSVKQGKTAQTRLLIAKRDGDSCARKKSTLIELENERCELGKLDTNTNSESPSPH